MALYGQDHGSVREAADHYGVSTKTIRRWIAQGRLDAVRVGPKLLRVDLASDERLVRVVPTARRSA